MRDVACLRPAMANVFQGKPYVFTARKAKWRLRMRAVRAYACHLSGSTKQTFKSMRLGA